MSFPVKSKSLITAGIIYRFVRTAPYSLCQIGKCDLQCRAIVLFQNPNLTHCVNWFNPKLCLKKIQIKKNPKYQFYFEV